MWEGDEIDVGDGLHERVPGSDGRSVYGKGGSMG